MQSFNQSLPSMLCARHCSRSGDLAWGSQAWETWLFLSSGTLFIHPTNPESAVCAEVLDVSGQGYGRARICVTQIFGTWGSRPNGSHLAEAQDLGTRASLVLCPYGAGGNSNHVNHTNKRVVDKWCEEHHIGGLIGTGGQGRFLGGGDMVQSPGRNQGVLGKWGEQPVQRPWGRTVPDLDKQ